MDDNKDLGELNYEGDNYRSNDGFSNLAAQNSDFLNEVNEDLNRLKDGNFNEDIG